MQKLIFDCDNTMGLHGQEVDDGLALMYLLGRPEVELLGVTMTFGNSSLDNVVRATTKMFNDLGLSHIPLHKGAPSPPARHSEASEFLAGMANRYPGEVTLLATGALTNLYGAVQLDPHFFDKLKSIVLMGGLTEPLIIKGQRLNELNFSCDPQAACRVLQSKAPLTIVTGHCCLQAMFGQADREELEKRLHVPTFRYIMDGTETWHNVISDKFETEGFYNWDTVAAFYVTHPHSFENAHRNISPSVQALRSGLIEWGEERTDAYKVNIPTRMKNKDEFRTALLDAWENVHVPMME